MKPPDVIAYALGTRTGALDSTQMIPPHPFLDVV